jgi:hypothetical protein
MEERLFSNEKAFFYAGTFGTIQIRLAKKMDFNLQTSFLQGCLPNR